MLVVGLSKALLPCINHGIEREGNIIMIAADWYSLGKRSLDVQKAE